MAKSKKKKYNKKKKNPNRVPQGGTVKKASSGGASGISKADPVRQRQMWIALAVAIGVFVLLLLIATLTNRNHDAAPDTETVTSGDAESVESGDSVTDDETADAASVESGDAATASAQSGDSVSSGDATTTAADNGNSAANTTATDSGNSATATTATNNDASAATATDNGNSAAATTDNGASATDSVNSTTNTTSTDNNASAATTTSGDSATATTTNATNNDATAATATDTASLQSADDVNATEYADIVVKDYGTITVALDGETAPITAQNFVSLAKSGFYDGLTFHRIMDGFMIQGGDPKGDGTGGAENNIVGEFQSNGFVNNISHTRGTISMARASGDENSASSQFFIVQTDSAFLDGDYAAFGHVTSGMEVVDKICADAKPIDNNGTIKPEEQPIIESVTIRDN